MIEIILKWLADSLTLAAVAAGAFTAWQAYRRWADQRVLFAATMEAADGAETGVLRLSIRNNIPDFVFVGEIEIEGEMGAWGFASNAGETTLFVNRFVEPGAPFSDAAGRAEWMFDVKLIAMLPRSQRLRIRARLAGRPKDVSVTVPLIETSLV